MTASEFLQAFSERLAAPLTCRFGGPGAMPATELPAVARRIAPGVS